MEDRWRKEEEINIDYPYLSFGPINEIEREVRRCTIGFLKRMPGISLRQLDY
ncbi:MAG: hypothetical protein HWD61_03350 [Parachlamydiaceae bacterium]|nr:MAG: hypothetical protein HWD61_03350 [Parachlamydiaceae bacterium]